MIVFVEPRGGTGGLCRVAGEIDVDNADQFATHLLRDYWEPRPAGSL